MSASYTELYLETFQFQSKTPGGQHPIKPTDFDDTYGKYQEVIEKQSNQKHHRQKRERQEIPSTYERIVSFIYFLLAQYDTC